MRLRTRQARVVPLSTTSKGGSAGSAAENPAEPNRPHDNSSAAGAVIRHTPAALALGISTSENRDGSAGGLDLLLGGARERVGADLDLDGQVALAENLHRLVFATRALRDEGLGG